jgi:hypothetical protein
LLRAIETMTSKESTLPRISASLTRVYRITQVISGKCQSKVMPMTAGNCLNSSANPPPNARNARNGGRSNAGVAGVLVKDCADLIDASAFFF